MTRQHICILYPYHYLPYSPTVLNLYDELARSFHVTILCCNPIVRKVDEVSDRNVALLPAEPHWRETLYRAALLLLRTLKLSGLKTKKSETALNDYRASIATRRAVHMLSPDQLIAVDGAIRPVRRQMARLPTHLLSLELHSTIWSRSVDVRQLSSVIIESEKRLNYLFPGKSVRAFFVPVSPVYKPLSKPHAEPGSLLYCGSAIGPFGLHRFLQLLAAYPGLTLTIKGRMKPATFERVSASHSRLLRQGRLIIDSSYTPEPEMAAYVSRYRIGLCFYDPEFEQMNSFHFKNVNSQKVYRYFASGIPVVANRLDGLRAVEEREAGILLSDLSPDSIYEAIKHIEQSYDRFVQNCFNAARDFSFDRHIAPFSQYLEELQHAD